MDVYNRTSPIWYPTATVQIAYNDINSNVNQVIIVQLSKFKNLPRMLISFLSNANIKKVGRCINQDISHLKTSYKSDEDAFEAQNIVDIGNYCKERGLISRINTSLAEICAVVLGCQLKKGTETHEKAIGIENSLTINYAMLHWILIVVYRFIYQHHKYQHLMNKTLILLNENTELLLLF
ncbi:hypothetical protein BDC45DRAFT_542289 [Circinella umbellata]|nr:hypothetical protein BDC45DRAFT_542289 [Circinella umbellata]